MAWRALWFLVEEFSVQEKAWEASMEATVSLLDEEHYRLTVSLWSELESQFGLRGIHVTPFPHFSYHVAQEYDKESNEN
jgi:hypothetical protein